MKEVRLWFAALVARPWTAAPSQPRSSWSLLALVSLLGLLAGYVLPRPPRQGGDLLDAVAAVQRRAPRFLVSEPLPTANWGQSGALYLCRTPRTAQEVDGLSKHPGRPDPRWAGVVCFKATANPNQFYVPWVADGGDRCLDYGAFAVFGDTELLQEMRAILAAEGFHALRDL
jgi:hypothetical protein